MFELYGSKLKGKVYRLIFNMNSSSRIKVKTSVGVTQSAVTDPLVAQGTVEAGVISSNNIDKGVNVAFVDSDCEVKYVDLPLAPTIFMDDIGKMAESIKAAQEGNTRMEDMIESKCLSFN